MDFSISDHLIIPYGVEKWRIEDIRVTAVSTSKTYFRTDIPIVHINKHDKDPLRIGKVATIDKINPSSADSKIGFKEVFNHYAKFCDQSSSFELKFLEHYYNYVMKVSGPINYKKHIGKSHEISERLKRMEEETNSKPPRNSHEWVWASIFPIPQAHLHLTDPLRDNNPTGDDHLPQHMVKVDFAFWLGDRFLALEIDGSSHVGDEKHILKNRWLQRAGVEVIHVLNSEIDEFKENVIRNLLPKEISLFWENFDETRLSHIDPYDIPF